MRTSLAIGSVVVAAAAIALQAAGVGGGIAIDDAPFDGAGGGDDAEA